MLDSYSYCNNPDCDSYGKPEYAESKKRCIKENCGHVKYRCPKCHETLVEESGLICIGCRPTYCANCECLLRRGNSIDSTDDLYCNYCAAEMLHYGYYTKEENYIDSSVDYDFCKGCKINLVHKHGNSDFCTTCIVKLQDERCVKCEREMYLNPADNFSHNGMCNDCYFNSLPNNQKFSIIENHYPSNNYNLCSGCFSNLIKETDYMCHKCLGIPK